jgi:hypothetical protein
VSKHFPVAAPSQPPSFGAAATLRPDCGGPLSYRIVDEDTRCSYQVDEGEHYCRQCDGIWTDESLAAETFPASGAKMSYAEALDRISRVFLGVPVGADPALAVPAKPVSRLGATRCDPGESK